MKRFNVLILCVLLIGFFYGCNQDETPGATSTSFENPESKNAPISSIYEKPAAFENALKIVDELPLFSGCETKQCSNHKLIEYIQKNLKYPETARSEKLEGRVFIQFIVETDGSVTNTYIAKDIGGGCGQAAEAIVKDMNNLETKWTPGIHEGQPVDVAFTLPFSFKLEKDEG